MQQDTPQIAVDPNLASEQARAKQEQVSALQTQAQGDTAALMSRYGTMLAVSGAGSNNAAPASSGQLTPIFGGALAAAFK